MRKREFERPQFPFFNNVAGVFQINPFIQIKYSLITPPEVFKSYVDLDFKVILLVVILSEIVV